MEDYRLTAVYKKEEAIISLYEDDDHDFIYISDSRDKTWVKVPEWDYDIDEYDFMYLEDGYDIFYMSMETHTGFWNLINLYYDEYDHIDGMQKYFDYCIENQITCDLLETLFHEEIPDIYEYKYSNEEVMQR
ncbi:hypothetical protein [Catenibacterium mitsuokai]|uniref:hypothetical protein n=1 Tax=Catenibacterium mitsuokai TaxID=100886 RepID=UPI0022E8CC7A|nr:hypothetical protein [Catenibacterium mitsuokai]